MIFVKNMNFLLAVNIFQLLTEKYYLILNQINTYGIIVSCHLKFIGVANSANKNLQVNKGQ